ncbi:uncharacterized protein si:dkey-9i23.16 [Toxotes jaculatrix]|uniref:uncharacterized protein si:dkey-9i23.16 n=1 Tax=Toxotes jaculatrix TaxID=941984 RepID=UPI001B3AE992|nr:uncharacterized protein si:dkey-9i23.16 [Toxotes jaculatrix]
MPSPGAVATVEPRLYRFAAWFDPESAGVLTILFGLFQVVLSVPLAYADQALPKLFILPLGLGILIMAGGSFTMANERNPRRVLVQGCAYSNVAGLVGALLAFCTYCYSLSTAKSDERCASYEHDRHVYRRRFSNDCPPDVLAAYCWSVTLLLLLYSSGAMVLHCLLSVSALKALKTA